MTLLALLALPGGVNAANDTIGKLNIKVISVNETTAPPTRIAKRIAASVNTVGEHVLLGRRVSDIAAGQASYERIIKEVFDRILVGYTVETVTIKPGPETTVIVELSPWGEVVRDVTLQVDYGNVSPESVALIKADMGNVEDKISNVLVGLPIDAVDWAGGVSKTVIQEVFEEQLPEFRSNIDVEAGEHTVVKLLLVPAGPTIQDIQVSLRSQTIPHIFLSGIESVFLNASKNLIGLPVAFVERHRDYYTGEFGETASKHHLAHTYGLTLTPVINPGAETLIAVNADTKRYNIWLEGYLDIGREENDNTSARLHAGKYIGVRDELFAEVNFIPSNVSWEFVPGWSHRIGLDTYAGAKYNYADKQAILTLNQRIGDNWSLRAERRPAVKKNEVGIRYRLHEYLSAEYIISDDESWLRLIGHF